MYNKIKVNQIEVNIRTEVDILKVAGNHSFF